MLDLAMLGFVLVGFILLIGYATLCVRLMPAETSGKDGEA
jgi:hypothetical protein